MVAGNHDCIVIYMLQIERQVMRS